MPGGYGRAATAEIHCDETKVTCLVTLDGDAVEFYAEDGGVTVRAAGLPPRSIATAQELLGFIYQWVLQL